MHYFCTMKSLEHKTDFIFDLFFAILFMPLLMLLGPASYWWAVSPVFTCLAVADLYGCYYATKFFQFPQLILNRRYAKLAIISALMVIVTYLLTCYPLPKVNFLLPSMSEYQTRMRNYHVTISLWFMWSVVMGYAVSVAFIKELYYRRLLQSIAESQRNRAELALFKAQITPHFLFNTLNSLYSLVIGTSDKAEEAFIKFTELLRYSYVTAGNDWVSIRDEANYISNYIDLERIRLNSHTTVVWECEVDDDSTIIPPMIFLTFVENAFKYGASNMHDSNITIQLRLEKGRLQFTTTNPLMKHADDFRKELPVGISNCRSRLEAIYPHRHQLHILEEKGLFTVYLEINLNNHE